MTLCLTIHLDHTLVDEMQESAEWAVGSGLLTEDEAVRAVANALLDSAVIAADTEN